MGLLRQIQPISFVDSEYTNFVLFFALAYAFFCSPFPCICLKVQSLLPPMHMRCWEDVSDCARINQEINLKTYIHLLFIAFLCCPKNKLFLNKGFLHFIQYSSFSGMESIERRTLTMKDFRIKVRNNLSKSEH